MLRVMSFNIRYGTAEDGENRWERRKPLVIERIKAFQPDLLGLQECRDDEQAQFIKASLPEYEYYGVPRGGDSVTALEMDPILFKKEAFQLLQKGHFWLSETPHSPGSISWGSAFPRTATWVELLHSISGKRLIFLNTHFDYEPSAIDASAGLLREWIEQNGRNRPLLVTGDFNADKKSTAYRQLVSSHPFMRDVFGTQSSNTENQGSFHGFGKVRPSAIDWILVSDHFEVIDTKIDRFHEGSLYPSDHDPLMALVEFK